ncbi:hypothetical protein GCM10009663_16370 [Kitasatospora arboriphila]|uniref:Uncharacterized protein n=1 Tax=Kitasatospora arboriphila TaxID=258052 RepID=A0ABP4DZV2_9ACTN
MPGGYRAGRERDGEGDGEGDGEQDRGGGGEWQGHCWTRRAAGRWRDGRPRTAEVQVNVGRPAPAAWVHGRRRDRPPGARCRVEGVRGTAPAGCASGGAAVRSGWVGRARGSVGVRSVLAASVRPAAVEVRSVHLRRFRPGAAGCGSLSAVERMMQEYLTTRRIGTPLTGRACGFGRRPDQRRTLA